MTEILADLKGWVIAFVGVVVWAVRLEARANANSKEILAVEARIVKQRAEDEARHEKQRHEDQERQSAVLKEIQKDVKELLQRTSR